ncbi:MAG TPA: guanylate kinase [Polyangia bacterium]|nr:guanylate kinase [Polyangia bacterium]
MSSLRQQTGLLVVISSPSGAGKTTLCQRLLKDEPQLVFSVSYTTRTMRSGERDGADYHFVDDAGFQKMVERDEFAEWAEVHGKRYGTSVRFVDEALSGGKDVLFDIDYQGGRQLRAKFEADALLVFILPPSLAELERRLRQRATDDEEVISKRLHKAHEEIEHYALYDFLIINDDLERAYAELRSIYRAAHLRRSRMADHAEALVRAAQTKHTK